MTTSLMQWMDATNAVNASGCTRTRRRSQVSCVRVHVYVYADPCACAPRAKYNSTQRVRVRVNEIRVSRAPNLNGRCTIHCRARYVLRDERSEGTLRARFCAATAGTRGPVRSSAEPARIMTAPPACTFLRPVSRSRRQHTLLYRRCTACETSATQRSRENRRTGLTGECETYVTGTYSGLASERESNPLFFSFSCGCTLPARLTLGIQKCERGTI